MAWCNLPFSPFYPLVLCLQHIFPSKLVQNPAPLPCVWNRICLLKSLGFKGGVWFAICLTQWRSCVFRGLASHSFLSAFLVSMMRGWLSILAARRHLLASPGYMPPCLYQGRAKVISRMHLRKSRKLEFSYFPQILKPTIFFYSLTWTRPCVPSE